MQLEELVELISKSANRLADAVKRSAATVEKSTEKEGKAEKPRGPDRDECWWAGLAEEDWNLIKLSWELRGVILRREPSHMNRLKNELEEILKEAEG